MSFVATIRNSFSDENYIKIVTAMRSSRMRNDPKVLEATKVEMSVWELKEMYDYLFKRLSEDITSEVSKNTTS